MAENVLILQLLSILISISPQKQTFRRENDFFFLRAEFHDFTLH